MTTLDKKMMMDNAITGAKQKGFVPMKVGAFTYALVFKGNLNGDIVFIKAMKGTIGQYVHTTRYAHLKNKKDLKVYFNNLHTKKRDYRQFSLYYL